MITIKNVRNLDGSVEDHIIESQQDQTIDAQGRLLLLPAMIAPHLNFETPDSSFPFAWGEGARQALSVGITTIFGMPKNLACITKDQLQTKMLDINAQLERVNLPLDYKLYLGAEKDHLTEIGLVKAEIAGVKVALGSPTNERVIQDPATLDRLFQIAGMENVIVAPEILDDPIHPNDKIVEQATENAIEYAIKYSNQVFFSRIRTRKQVDLLRQSQLGENLIYGSTTAELLAHATDKDVLWEGIHDGTLDIIACDTHELKTFLPLLCQACKEKKIQFAEIINCTVVNPSNIFNIERNNDAMLLDPESGHVLFTILKGKAYPCTNPKS